MATHPQVSPFGRVRAAVASPNLRRNLRGQVKAALACLSEGDQKRLACMFARRGLEILLSEEKEKLEAFAKGIEEIEKFLVEKTDIHIVREVYLKAENLDTTVTPRPLGEAITVGRVGHILGLLESCCCQRELEEARLIYRAKFQPDAFSVAEAVSRGIARHVGGADWNSEDPELREAARDCGRKASQAESAWQRDQILDYAATLADDYLEAFNVADSGAGLG